MHTVLKMYTIRYLTPLQKNTQSTTSKATLLCAANTVSFRTKLQSRFHTFPSRYVPSQNRRNFPPYTPIFTSIFEQFEMPKLFMFASEFTRKTLLRRRKTRGKTSRCFYINHLEWNVHGVLCRFLNEPFCSLAWSK